MSEKERATALLELVPEYKMGYVIAIICGTRNTAISCRLRKH